MVNIQSNKINITVTKSSCSCPTGDVCANPDGTCPKNSFPDNYFPGCCIPCSQLIPASVSVNVPNTNLYYMVNHTLNSGDYLPYVPVPSTGGCNKACDVPLKSSGATPCYLFDFVVSGRVTDSAGHGICNQKVNIYPQQAYYEVNIDYTEIFYFFPVTITVYWAIYTGSGGAVTDSNGNFSVNIKAWAYPYASTTSSQAISHCYNGNLATQPVTIVAEVEGTGISGIGIGDIYLNTWDNGGYKI